MVIFIGIQCTMLPYHSEEFGLAVGCREECHPKNGGTHDHDDPLPHQHWPGLTGWKLCIALLAN
jgi:hypothetical protein